MPNEDKKILKYNHGEKSMKSPFIIYADLESLPEKISTCHDSPEKSSATKINKHTSSGYSLFTYSSFDETKNMLSHDRGKNCMKNFCLDLKKHAKKIINYEKRDDTANKKKRKTIISKKFVMYVKKNLIQMIAIKNPIK